MNQLITITENNGNKAVSARELYQYLEITERFNNWFERQLKYGFEEGVDFLGCEVFNTLANQTITDYALSIDTAKEISMLQRTDKGKQARRYFIAVEKKATQPQPVMLDKELQHHTLLALLKQNLRKGDMKDIANESGFTYDAVRNIFYASSRRPEVIKAIFEKAMANKKLMTNPQDMINQLTKTY